MTDRVTHMSRLHPHSPPDERMGALMVQQKRMRLEDVEHVLRFQQERGLRFGDAAIALGLVSESQVREVLNRQFGCEDTSGAPPDENAGLVAAHNPLGPEMEEMRVLRSELKIRWFDRGKKSLAMVCVDSEEDCNVVVGNMGVVFSRLGVRTLVVDANLRRPAQHLLFGTETCMGLSDLLAKRATFEQIRPVPRFPDLFVLSAGTPAPNPYELLSRETFRELKATFDEAFDVVLYALPSYAAGKADVIAVAAVTKGALIVASKDRTSLNDLAAVTHHLSGVDVEIVGAVLTTPKKTARKPSLIAQMPWKKFGIPDSKNPRI